MKKQTNRADRKSTDKKLSLFSSRKGTLLLSLMVIMLIVVNLIVSSYSWFTPASQKGTGVKYNTPIEFRSEKCSMKQYTGTENAGVIEYSEITTIDQENYQFTLSGGDSDEGSTYYFKTEITNDDPNYPTIVSLFFSSIAAPSGGTVGFGVAEPSNSYRTYNSALTDYYVIRNAYIEKNDGHNIESSISVKWFVKVPKNASAVIDLRNMYVTYN